MSCNHEQLRCTDNVFFCVLCGAQVTRPVEVDKESTPAATPAEAPKRAVKRTTKKRGE